MKQIKNIVELINEEIHDANKYYIEILKTDDRKCKEIFSYIGLQELDHAMKLHDMAVTLIKEQKSKNVPIPPGMEDIWEFEHKSIIEETTDLRSKLTKF